MTEFDASLVIYGIYVGSHPAFDGATIVPGDKLVAAGFNVCAPCAAELQSVKPSPGLNVLHCPLHDDYETVQNPAKLTLISLLVDSIVSLHRTESKILITCAEGRNRSAMIAALSLKRILGIPGEEAIKLVREARNPAVINNSHGWYKQGRNYVLTNEAFEKYVITEQPVSMEDIFE